MAGIFGLVTNDGQQVIERDLESMAAPLCRLSFHQVDSHAGQTAGLGAVRLTNEPAIARQQKTWLAVTGMVLQQDELRQSLLKAGFEAPVSTQAELLLGLYLMFGLESLTNLNGSYALAIWEENQRRLTLVRDRLGMSNLYYGLKGGRLMFASEYKAITWHPNFGRALNDTAVVDLFLHGQVMGERTLFADIYSLPPAGVLVYEDGNLQVRSSADLPVYQPESDGRRFSFNETLEEFYMHLRQAVRRRAMPGSCLLLTGGLDSRTIAALFRREAPDLVLQTATLGRPGCLDALSGRQVAARLGFGHHLIPIDTDYLNRFAALTAWRAEGKLNAYAGWIYAFEPFLIANGFRTTLTGLMGEVLAGRNYPPGLEEAQTEEKAILAATAKIAVKMRRLRPFLRPEIAEQTLAESMDARREAYRRAPTSDWMARYDYMYIRSVYSRYPQGNDVLGDASVVLDPFTDRDLVDFALSIPPRVKAGDRFQLRLLTDYLPEVAGIRYERTGRNLPVEAFFQQYRWLALTDVHLSRMTRKVAARLNVGPEPCIPHRQAIRTTSRPLVEYVLKQENILGGLFNVPALQEAVTGWLNNGPVDYEFIGALVTYVLWYEQFVLKRKERRIDESKPAVEKVSVLQQASGSLGA